MKAPLPYRDGSAQLEITLHEPDARLQHIPEAVLQDLWRRLDFDTRGLTTTDGQSLEILDPGIHNLDGGPDFANAHLRIGEVEWHGDVEIHRTSGEWLVHRHHEDSRYDRVVLHVVLGADRHSGRLVRSDGTPIAETILLPHLTSSLRGLLFRFFAQPTSSFPCASQWADVPDRIRRPWLRLLGQERLRDRLAPVVGGLPVAADLDDVLYRAVARALGYAPNADAMETLARRIPLRRLRQIRSPRDIEALLLGAAGLLPEPPDLPAGDEATVSYAMELLARYGRMPESSAPTMLPTAWQFARLRPANTPARRIAQLVALCRPGGLLHHDPLPAFRACLDMRRPLTKLRALLTSVEPDPYWQTHTRLESRCREMPAGLGKARADGVLLNAVLPVLLLVAEREGDVDLEDRVLDLIAALPASNDRVTRRFEEQGAGPDNALEAQGLHQLYRTRCTAGRCLSCSVGRFLLGR